MAAGKRFRGRGRRKAQQDRSEAISAKKTAHVAKRRSNRLGLFHESGITRMSEVLAPPR